MSEEMKEPSMEAKKLGWKSVGRVLRISKLELISSNSFVDEAHFIAICFSIFPSFLFSNWLLRRLCRVAFKKWSSCQHKG